MSIPKEPRQLMINLMYLVLTAMLALNVSAEVMQALFSMDKSLAESSKLVQRSNEQLALAIQKQADAYSQYEPFKEKVYQTQQATNDFFDFTKNLREDIIENAGGLDKNGLPKEKDNKGISQRIMLKNGKAGLLKNQILTTREKLLSLIEDKLIRNQIGESIPLKINPIPIGSDKKTWEQFTFQQMPVAAVLPMLSKFQNDVKLTETTILNHFFSQMNMDVVRPDKFHPVISTNNNYVIRGEKYEGEIFLAAYSSTADNLSISVDGNPLKVENGKAIFTSNPSSIGGKNHTMKIEMTNPITGEMEVFSQRFGYQVGDRSVAISLDKMNTMYVGIENPLSISVAGIASQDMRVSANGLNLKKKGNERYTAIPTKIGNATITISGGGLKPTTLKYRIKKIPAPVMHLGTKTGGSINKAEFKAQQGLIPIIENFDFDAKCKVDGFEVTRVHNGNPVSYINKSARFTGKTRELIDHAKRKDVYYFEKIKVRCPGDIVGRKMPEMYFNIK